jgi:hypothetical protein
VSRKKAVWRFLEALDFIGVDSLPFAVEKNDAWFKDAAGFLRFKNRSRTMRAS